MSRTRALFLILIPVTAALGRYLLPLSAGGVTFFLFRLLVVGGLLLTPFLAFRIHWWKYQIARLYAIVGYIWIAWGAVSVYWAPDLVTAVSDVAAVGFGFAVGFLMFNLGGGSTDGVRYIRYGWVAAFSITAVVAVWEIVTGNHLPSSYVERTPDYALRFIVVSTFGNPNNYGAFIVLCFPFLLASIPKASRSSSKFAFTALAGLALILVFVSASRSALAGVLVQILVYVTVFGTKKRVAFVASCAAAAILIVINLGITIEDFRLWSKLTSALSGAEAGQGGSLGLRLALTLSGVWMLTSTYGMGVGAGGFEHVVSQGLSPHATGGLINPHNFLIEVASEYGLMTTILFVVLLARAAWIVWLERIHGDRQRAEIGVLMTVGYPLASVANSSYMEVSVNWVFIASLVCVAMCLHSRHRHSRRLHSSNSQN